MRKLNIPLSFPEDRLRNRHLHELAIRSIWGTGIRNNAQTAGKFAAESWATREGKCYFCPRTQSANVCQSGSFCDVNCLPPVWKGSPPTSGASGCMRSRLEVGSPGTTSREATSKLRLDCSSVQDKLPAGSFSSRKPVAS